MADVTVTYPEPTDTTDGLKIVVERDNGAATITITYTKNGRIFGPVVLTPASFTATQRTQLTTVVQFIIAAAKTALGF